MLAQSAKTLSQLFQMRIAASEGTECYRVKQDEHWVPASWNTFAEQVRRLSVALLDEGLKKGDAVAIMGKTSPEWCVADMGSIFIGGVTVGVYDTLLEDQIQFICNDSKVRFFFARGKECYDRALPMLKQVKSLKKLIVWDYEPEEPHAKVVTLESLMTKGRTLLEENPLKAEAAAAKVGSEDVALVVYTSGTTGRPKGVPLSHGNVLAQLISGEGLVDDVGPEDITLSFLPMAHVAEHVPGFFGRLNTGMRTAFATDYDSLLDELTEIRPTYFGAVPRIFEKMYGRIHERVAHANPRRQKIFSGVKHLAVRRAQAAMGGPPLTLKERLLLPLADRFVFRKIRDVFGGRVKAFVTGAAPIDMEILEFFYGVGMKIIEVYGLSEATAISVANTLQEQHLGTVGRPIPGVKMKLAEDGEILLKGPTVFGGYLNLPEENSQIFDDDGYLKTGDIGILDDNGCLRITDRKKNLIKTAGGKYVVPARIEALVKSEPLVSQVYVHGDNRPYVVSLVTLDDREAGRVADELGCTTSDLPTHPAVAKRVAAAVDKANAKLARFEQIKRHAVLPQDFSLEEDTLTPTLKLKRRIIADKYASVIDSLYEQASAAHAAQV